MRFRACISYSVQAPMSSMSFSYSWRLIGGWGSSCNPPPPLRRFLENIAPECGVISTQRTTKKLRQSKAESWSRSFACRSDFEDNDEPSPRLSELSEFQASQFPSTALSPDMSDPCHMVFWGLNNNRYNNIVKIIKMY